MKAYGWSKKGSALALQVPAPISGGASEPSAHEACLTMDLVT
jgi:hypothetical protein